MDKQLNLYVVETMGSGGMIHYAYQMCNALAEQANVTLVTTQDYELTSLPHKFDVVKQMNLWQMFDPNAGKGTRSTFLGKLKWGVRRAWRGGKLFWEWMKLTRFLLNAKPDVVQFGKINFPFEALFLRYMGWRGLRLAQICHEFEARESSKLGAALSDSLSGGVFSNFETLFFHGESNRSRFLELHKGMPASATHIIDHGNQGIFRQLAVPNLDLRTRYGYTTDQPIALFFGNLTPSKGLPDLFEAFALVHEHCPTARLLVAGYPSKHMKMPALHAQIQQLGLEKIIQFDARYIPFEEVGALMELATCVVYPYRSSTQSGSLQVAYSFARPVVATRVGGLPEAVEEGKSGFLADPENPSQLATALLNLLTDPHCAKALGEYAHNLSQTRFSWDTIASQIITVYQNN